MRLTVVDGFRGFFLLFMTLTHADYVLNVPLGKVSHHYFGWVEDAQGFVFLSGLVVGLVYGRRLLRSGDATMRSSVFARIRVIYAWHAGLVLLLLSAALLLPQVGIVPEILAQFAREPMAFTLASLGLVTGTLHMGILPLYIWMMIATPWLLIAFRNGKAPVVFALSAFLWMLAQTGGPDQLQIPAEAALREAGAPINIGIYFNVFAWQVLYVAGLWFGWRMAEGRLGLGWLATPVAAQVAAVAFAAFLMLGIYDVVFYTGWGGEDWREWVFRTIDRGNLHYLYLFAFVVDLYLVAWLVNAAPQAASRPLAAAGRAVNWVFSRSWLTLLGRHSLQIFATQVVVVYVLTIAVQDLEVAEVPVWLRTAALLATVVPLFAVAAWRERRNAAPSPAPRLGSA